jgi:hypothetical protein
MIDENSGAKSPGHMACGMQLVSPASIDHERIIIFGG